jgi:RNA polymerase sigma factor for flagellar operon FliA
VTSAAAAAGGELSSRDELILEHMPLLHHIAGRMAIDSSGRMDRDDLAGFGMLGLIAAADAWDASRGLKFSTFAYTKIRGAILDELRKLDFLPRGQREKVRDLDRCVQRIEQARGTRPTPEELADELGVDEDEVSRILQAGRMGVVTSLDDGGPTSELASLLSDPTSDDPVGSAEWSEMRGRLAEAIAGLPEQEQTVVNLYYAEELLLREIAEVLGVTESRVSQIHTRAIYRLNRTLSAESGAARGAEE